MDVQTYSAWSRGLQQRTVSARAPLHATLEVTHRCPLACAHCYNNLPVGDAAAREAELTLPEYRRILAELADAGALWMLFTGGEIFARRDFLDIYTAAKEKGFLITLFTNGTLIQERIADHLARYRPFSIEITLYGRTRETYEALTGVPGSYDRCMRAIRLLLERRMPLSLKTVAVTLNVHELWDMRRFAEEELGVPFKFDASINPRIDCSSSPLAVRLSPAQVVALDALDPRRRESWEQYARTYAGRERERPRDSVYSCGGGVQSFSIDPSGRMSICVLSHQESYDLRQGTFLEGWNGFLRSVRERKVTRNTRCLRCALQPLCGMCAANGELESNDPERPVEFLCELGHVRAHAFGIAIPEHGDCDYCEGGRRHDAVARAGRDLRDGTGPSAATGRPKRLPVLHSDGGTAGAGSAGPLGCGGCG